MNQIKINVTLFIPQIKGQYILCSPPHQGNIMIMKTKQYTLIEHSLYDLWTTTTANEYTLIEQSRLTF